MLPIVNLVLDIVILVALGATIVYCLKLSRQFTQMQADRRAFETLISALNVAIARADSTLKTIREGATSVGQDLQDSHKRARAMADELEFMIEAGDTLANRLQAIAESTRRAQTTEPAEQPRTRAEQELLEAVKAKTQS